MLSKLAKAAFSSFNPTPKGGFNALGALNRLKSGLRAPIKHIKRNIEPSAVNYGSMTNTTEEAFDEVSHEWQTLVTSNPFDIQVFNYLENAQNGNFGTVDNPAVIFTSDMPFRYVGCTGQMNEDDYEGHELIYFMLREGPLQRCPSCGQVFKLVRLRNEYSPEMDYYLSNFHTYDMIEMGESDTTILMSLFKYASHYEYTQMETPSNMVYSMVNPDEHDRLLIDPAYRLERTAAMEEKFKVYLFSLQEVERKFVQNFGPLTKTPISKVDFQTMIDVEKQIARMDRLFRKVSKFHNRKFIDSENHERREARMNKKASERWDNNYSFFFGGLTEEEQRYRDYFQTDLENYPEDESIEQKLDEQEILTRPENKLSNFDFQEGYTRTPEDDQTSAVEKIAFQFKYRLAKDSMDVYLARQQRMIQRQVKRFQDAGIRKEIEALTNSTNSDDLAEAVLKEKRILDFIVNDSIQQIQDYFEDDKTIDFTPFKNLSTPQKAHLLSVFENHVAPQGQMGGFQTIPKRQWDGAFGVWTNFLHDFSQFSTSIIPKATVLANNAQCLQSLPLTEKEQLEAANVDAKKL